MAIFNLFSKRQKTSRGEVPDVYQYVDIPEHLRVQIVHIIRDTFGVDRYSQNRVKILFEFIHDSLCREYGFFTLHEMSKSHQESVFQFFLGCEDYEKVIDVIEIVFKVIDTDLRDYNYQHCVERLLSTPDQAIEELNQRARSWLSI